MKLIFKFINKIKRKLPSYKFTLYCFYCLFKDLADIKIIKSGFDIDSRRFDWNGGEQPLKNDYLGAFRENWYSFIAFTIN